MCTFGRNGGMTNFLPWLIAGRDLGRPTCAAHAETGAFGDLTEPRRSSLPRRQRNVRGAGAARAPGRHRAGAWPYVPELRALRAHGGPRRTSWRCSATLATSWRRWRRSTRASRTQEHRATSWCRRWTASASRSRCVAGARPCSLRRRLTPAGPFRPTAPARRRRDGKAAARHEAADRRRVGAPRATGVSAAPATCASSRGLYSPPGRYRPGEQRHRG